MDLFELVEQRACRHQAILRHFDEAMEPCGDACDACSGVSVEARALSEALLEIPGVGPAKLERYGEAFLQAAEDSP